jgi:acetylornithine/LysW-gamma-L-lysine aminotransferase
VTTTTPTPATGATAPAFDAGFAGHRGLELVRGEGAFVFDDAGRRYLDGASQYGVALLGHAHPAVARAVAEQAGRLVSCFASFSNDQRTALLQRLAGLLAPLDRFFLCNSGTEAIEATLKLARVATRLTGVVALTGAFHGRTMGALSATWRPSHKDDFAPLLDGVHHVRPGDLAALEERLATGTIGLVILEVVQGEGGVKPLDGDYLRTVQAACRRHGALFACDEVQSGMGRTGRWFAYQHHGLDPDIVTLAKGVAGGVPLGVMAFRGELGPIKTGSHGSTFGGNPLACAAALATIDVIEREGLVESAERNGRRLIEGLRAACGEHVREVRGLGLMVGLDLGTRPSAPVQKHLQDQGFLVLGAGPRVLRLLPPLVTPAEELDRLVVAIATALEATAGASEGNNP